MNAFVGGSDLPGLHALMSRMKDANRSVLVGVPAGAKMVSHEKITFDNGKTKKVKVTHESAGGGSLAMIAAVHEFGCPEKGIPERSFLRGGLRRATPKLNKLNELNLRKAVLGQGTVEKAIEMLGVVAAGEVKREFVVGEFAPNKPETIARKGSSRPLIDTGNLRQSVTYVIEGKQSANARVI